MNSVLGLKEKKIPTSSEFWMQTLLCNTVIKYPQDNLCFNNKDL